ncbi:hypothetical protein EIP91_010472 [Steccherinum ochraceum]|uniref:Jacalin-type lectin domain-containing protein n=1 Tax=Steccherinum ochraceum TaxID=92696 RepID=A0A4V2MX26_9APHY|nr:hypothetical protein EIP91_010472 [Steccherinum ochraceum]
MQLISIVAYVAVGISAVLSASAAAADSAAGRTSLSAIGRNGKLQIKLGEITGVANFSGTGVAGMTGPAVPLLSGTNGTFNITFTPKSVNLVFAGGDPGDGTNGTAVGGSWIGTGKANGALSSGRTITGTWTNTTASTAPSAPSP